MKADLVYVEGEAYVSLATIAECYDCTEGWVAEVYDFGLLGEGRRVGGSVVVEIRALDRVARVRQLYAHHGLDLEVIAVMLR